MDLHAALHCALQRGGAMCVPPVMWLIFVYKIKASQTPHVYLRNIKPWLTFETVGQTRFSINLKNKQTNKQTAHNKILKNYLLHAL